MPRLLALLRSVGVAISKRQLVRLLNENHEGFITEAQDVLRAGLETSPFVSVDDTGARHSLPLRKRGRRRGRGRGRGKTAFAHRSAMTGSPGSALGPRRVV
jgi:hypothetical protein